ncbi:hypothetical protein FACS189481_3930 [Clostridia bacterium]|nr:hypothetical protein FACS189481_3930 [Clostridia bacterium]
MSIRKGKGAILSEEAKLQSTNELHPKSWTVWYAVKNFGGVIVPRGIPNTGEFKQRVVETVRAERLTDGCN